MASVAHATAIGPTACSDGVGRTNVIIPDSDRFDIRAAGTGTAYRVSVGLPLPADTHGGPPPMLCLLDAHDHFRLFVDLARSLAEAGDIVPLLIVGIGYPTDDPMEIIARRLYDFTFVGDPLHEALVRRIVGRGHVVRAGGADGFLHFIETELTPAIVARYGAVAAGPALAGHSLGGLLGLYALFSGRGGFSRYAISSPPLLWAADALAAQEAAYARSHADLPALLSLAAGAEETSLSHVLGLPDHLKPVERAFIAAVGDPDPLEQLDHFQRTLASRRYPSLVMDHHVFAGEGHAAVAAVAFRRALRVLYSKEGRRK